MTLKTALAAGAAALALAMASGALAQEITAEVRGQITSEKGEPVSGAKVTVTHVPTGTNFTATTDASGAYDAQNLRPGGPYTVTATGPGGTKTLKIADIAPGSPYQLDLSLGGEVSEVVVTGVALKAAQIQTGPRLVLNSGDIETLPSFNRDLRDVARLSPFVLLDPTNQNAMIVAGANNRTNTVYVDGVKQADDFGLNANGYPTQRSPISTAVVQSTSLDVAPFDVQYGSFQGGILNITTKTGSNDYHGSAYVEYDDQNMAGDQIGDRQIALRFRDVTYGATLGGPILKDRLFVFGGYEKTESSGASAPIYGPSGSNAPNVVPKVTQADVDAVRGAVKSVYGFDPLDWSDVSTTQTDEKWFGKVDLNITDRQRLVFEYQRTDGATTNNGGGSGTANSTSTTSPVLELASHWYNLGQLLEAYTGQLYSQWTDKLSTELSYSHKTVNQTRNPLAGNTFAEFDVTLPSGAKVILGPDISSQANVLNNTDQLLKAKAHYTWGNHVFTAGYEREWLDVFNLFAQNSGGQYVFDGTCGAGNGLTNLTNKTACSLVYANAATNVRNDAAASWGDVVNTLYLQDEWRPFDSLTVRYGLRAEIYQQDVAPALNSRFQQQYGFANTATLDGKAVWMPRVGFNWTPDNTFTVYGGVGLFSGGSPNVWISNDYTNTGNLIGSATCRPTGAQCASSLIGVTGTSIGDSAKAVNTAVANTNNGITNALDPDFKPPSVWKASIGMSKTFSLPSWQGNDWIGDDWNVHADFIYQSVKDAATWVDLLANTAVLATPAPDGRPRYGTSRYTTARPTGYDLLLTNSHDGGGEVWAVGLGKNWNHGPLEGLSFDFTYTGQHITDVNPGTSSVAASNYGQVAVLDPNNPQAAISNYEIQWSFKLIMGYRHAFFGDNFTDIRLYAQRRAGLTFSYTFDSLASTATAADQMFGESGTFASRDRQLLYVPKTDASGNVTAASDPIVTYAASFDVAKFNQFLKDTGLINYQGRITPRNAFRSRPQTTADMRISQEFPAFFPRHAKGRFYVDIIDLPNLLNSDWGVVQQISFPYFYSAIQARNCQNAGAGCAKGTGNFYQYDAMNTRTPTTTDRPSVYQIKVGFEYDF